MAWLLHDYYLDLAHFDTLSKDERHFAVKLLIIVNKTFSTLDEGTARDVLAVPDFLVKCIVRKYGMSSLMALCRNNTNVDFSWLIPKHLQKHHGENEVCVYA